VIKIDNNSGIGEKMNSRNNTNLKKTTTIAFLTIIVFVLSLLTFEPFLNNSTAEANTNNNFSNTINSSNTVTNSSTLEQNSTQVLAKKKKKKAKKAKKVKKTKVIKCTKKQIARKLKKCQKVLPPNNSRTLNANTQGIPGRAVGTYNPMDIQSINAGYWNHYNAARNVPTGWNGNEETCNVGTITQQSRNATLNALNYARNLAGLNNAYLDSRLNYNASQAALMMGANKTVSHSPGSNWKCYTAAGYDGASHGNLIHTYGTINSGNQLDLYLSEPGGNNEAVGHRRWILNPNMGPIGLGSTTHGNSMYVTGPQNYSNANPSFVSWPTAGYFPIKILQSVGRWSFSSGDDSTVFNNANVSIVGPNGPVNLQVLPVHDGYAKPTLVWQMPGILPAGDYNITVSGINGGSYSTVIYTVKLFNPF